ncbi:flippase-like domain-containing protein [Nonlabens mediterrranea]|uniref:Flippase-like domain-containing protein n=1 Tax=Nonlabens mediterrranea TaxID=1419947 RepID=A0ABS0A3S6_9FLAO|nr:flippase-like domain-containing protein [Nonlabens mediterrranea]
MTSTWHKAKQFLAPSIKILVFIGCITLLYFQWTDRPVRMDSILFYLKEIPFYSIGLMLLLSLTSWLVESKKWQVLLKDVEEIRFRESVIQSLTAQAASFITPLRAGEFAYKALFYEREDRKTILSRVFLGNLCQMIVTVFLGLIGLLFYIDKEFYGTLTLAITGIVCLAVIYAFYQYLSDHWNLKEVTFKLWKQTIALSLLRYLFFASNWLIMLQLIKSDIALLTWLDNIALNYLAVSIIPMFQIFDIPVKWAVADLIFNGGILQSPIVIATTLIWLTNTLFPTLLGCILIPFKKFKAL